MKTEWTFRRLNVRTKSELKDYWAKKVPRLERLLVRFADSLRDLTLAVVRQTAPDRFSVRATLRLPTRTLVAEVAEREPNAALDRLCDMLAGEIRKHRDHLRQQWGPRRNRAGDVRRASSHGANPPRAVGGEPSWPAPASSITVAGA